MYIISVNNLVFKSHKQNLNQQFDLINAIIYVPCKKKRLLLNNFIKYFLGLKSACMFGMYVIAAREYNLGRNLEMFFICLLSLVEISFIIEHVFSIKNYKFLVQCLSFSASDHNLLQNIRVNLYTSNTHIHKCQY